MKAIKFFLAVICMLLFCSNISYAGNMANDSIKSDTTFTKENNNYLSGIQYNPSRQQIDSVVTSMGNALDIEYKLSTEQKELIQKKIEKYAIALLKAKSIQDKEISYSIMNPVTQEYLIEIDNILTTKQKEQREKKLNDSIKSAESKSMSNTK